MPPLRGSSICACCAARALRPITRSRPASRALRFSTSPSTPATTTSAVSPADEPRWKQTPPQMRAPFRLRPRPNQPEWRVNARQEPLDEMYDRFLGRVGEAATGQEGLQGTRGRDLLPDDVKWLAITHKSHDHGRQGFNDRLAFLGKRILDLHASLSLLNGAPSAAGPAAPSPSHPALEGIDRITPLARSQVLAPARLAKLAHTYGLDQVVRWKPKKTQNLSGSGLDAVLAQAVYAIVGALALQRGGEVAVRCARERVLQPLGLR